MQALAVWGDKLVREVLDEESKATADDEEANAIAKRAAELAIRHPERRDQLLEEDVRRTWTPPSAKGGRRGKVSRDLPGRNLK